MDINFVYEPDCASAPKGFKTALTYAAEMLDRVITNPITINIGVGWGDVNYEAMSSSNVGEAMPENYAYKSVDFAAKELKANASGVDQQVLADLPSTQSASGDISNAQAKAWGLLPATTSGIDGWIGFGSNFQYTTTSPSVPTPNGEFSLVGVALHEITQAMGRVDGNGAFSLINYQSAGVLQTSTSTPGYFSLDGGKTDMGDFSTADAADFSFNWKLRGIDPFNARCYAGSYAATVLSQADNQMMNALGFDTTGPAPNQFLLRDNATGISAYQNGTAYSGPVSGIATDYAQITNDSINITGSTPNSFIHITGTGMDGINASACGGNNILDGSAGSDFLTGGSGNDIFYVDDRAPPQNVWSTLVNFHAGDHATVWGVSPADFTLTWIASAGAAGATGVTAVFSRDHSPTAGVTFAGYSMADVTSGRLAISYGVTANTQGATGAPYMNITGVG
jgi:hypothetical protein